MCWLTNMRASTKCRRCKGGHTRRMLGNRGHTRRILANRGSKRSVLGNCGLTRSVLGNRGQATVEAAFAIPIVFTLLLLLIQPGIILYDRMVMRSAAAEGCRLLAIRSDAAGLGDERCKALIKRQLSAVPPHDLFHIHASGCTWEIEISGGDTSGQVQVAISNRIRLLPLFDAAGALVGIADASGCLTLRVEEQAPTQPAWVAQGSLGLSPSTWANARKGA